VIRERLEHAAPLVLSAALAAAGVLTLPAGNPLRIAAGLALLVGLPWLAASRLPPTRQSDLAGSRISGSGALAFALVVLLGLLLSLGNQGIATRAVAIGMLLATAIVALLADLEQGPASRPLVDRQLVLGASLTIAAVAIAVAAFLIARDRAVTQEHQEVAYAAFLSGDGAKLDVGLTNATDGAARFTVRAVGRGGRRLTVRVPARSTREVRGFVDRPPALTPGEQFRPRRIEPRRIRVSVVGDSGQAPQALELSTYGPSARTLPSAPRSSLAQPHISTSSPRANTPSASR
jgi:hypothetical protein